VSDLFFEGYVELAYEQGVKIIEVRRDGEHVNVWVDGNMADDVETFSDLISQYGCLFYETLAHYKAGRSVSYDLVWPA
jgi:hypothetical protein